MLPLKHSCEGDYVFGLGTIAAWMTGRVSFAVDGLAGKELG